MKKLFVLIAGLAVVASGSFAATQTVTLSVTNGQAIKYSDAIPVSGVLDKIEVVQSSGATATVTIATFSGTTAVESFASLTALVGNKVVRPRVLPTDNTGTSLAAAFGGAEVTNVTQQLSVPYSRALLGGNIKMSVITSGACTTGTGTNTVTATLYYEKPSALSAW